MTKRVGIIGGGAAGLFTACQFKRLGAGSDVEVTVLERKNIPGIKLTLTGHGRCNITNRKDPSELKKGYHEAGNFIYPALKGFSPEDTIRFAETGLGLKLKEEDNNRMFPVCDSATKVRDTILSYIEDSAGIITGTKVTEVSRTDCFEVATESGTYHFDYCVLSCGGSSFAKTGSTADSYRLAESLGHTVNPVKGALAPVNADNGSAALCKSLSGVSVRAGVSVCVDGKKISSLEGDLLFAEHGLTGPAVMEISRDIPLEIKGNEYIELDLVPSMSDEEFDRELQQLINDHPDTKITTLLARYVPASVAGVIAAKEGCADMYAQGFTKENRRKVCRGMKHLAIGIGQAPEIDKAYVTRGGVSLREVDRKSMESKIVPGLYIIGEALDIDGISGGYNLQACMSEAYMAAGSILER